MYKIPEVPSSIPSTTTKKKKKKEKRAEWDPENAWV
jgi:hypothetical protein